MKPLEILSALPRWAKASPEDILDSPAFAMLCRLGEESVSLRPAAVEPADSDMLKLSVTFGDEPHTLRIARSPRFPNLDKLWDSRAEVPEAILLALVERECGALFQMLENILRKQLRLAGVEEGSLAPAEAKSVAFDVFDGSAQSQSTTMSPLLTFVLTRTSSVVSALGVMRNLDLSHEAVSSQPLNAEIEYAAFQLPDSDIDSLSPGDAVLLPEIGSIAPRLIVDGRFVLDMNGVAGYRDDALVRVRLAETKSISVGELLEGSASMQDNAPPVNAQLRLVRNGKALATGRLDHLGEAPAFIVETT